MLGESFSGEGEDSATFDEPDTLLKHRPQNMATLISVAQRDLGVQLFANAARGSGYLIGWEEAIADGFEGNYVLRAPVGDLAAYLLIILDEESVDSSTFQWIQAPGFPVCNPDSNTTLHLPWNEYINIGYSLPYDLFECATHEKSDVYSVTISDSQSVPLQPYATRLSLNRDDSIKDTLNGLPQGISNLEELTRVAPLPTISKRERTIEDLADFIRENLGEEGKEDLALIPRSMGGDGPELEGQEELMDCYLREGPSGDCTGGAPID